MIDWFVAGTLLGIVILGLLAWLDKAARNWVKSENKEYEEDG